MWKQLREGRDGHLHAVKVTIPEQGIRKIKTKTTDTMLGYI